ncbi:MAG: alpha-amylase family glycosyl hydrolase [Candidatus Saccharimonadales bacterium]
MSGGTRKKLGAHVHSRGVTFRVWAPNASSVEVCVPFVSYDTSNRQKMSAEKSGYWSLTVSSAEPGQTYKYIVTSKDGQELLRNDPRARAVTASDNGTSIIASNEFDWGDDLYMPLPKNEHVIYELHVGTFHRADPATQGTFYDAIEKLDYLASLGITMIELMPVTSMAESHGWGYNTNSMFAIENSYGGRLGLMTFVKACHERGIGVTADVVYNHFCDPDTWRFDGWYEHDRGGIYFYNDERGDTPWGARPDYGRREVRQCILDSVKMWFEEYRLDGLRLDSTSYMRNLDGSDDEARSIPDAWSLIQAITETAHRVRPGSLIIAEDTGSNKHVVKPKSEGGADCDAQWRLQFPESIYQAIGLQPRYNADIKQELMQSFTSDPYTRVVFSDSHDTAANGRARLNEEVSPRHGENPRAQRDQLIASTVVCTTAGIPMLLQGQEFMQDGAFNEWKELDWENVTTHQGVVDAHQELLALRRNTYQTSRGLTGNHTSLFHINDTNRVLAYHRWHTGGVNDDVVVIINFGNDSFPVYDLVVPVAGEWQPSFYSTDKRYGLSQDYSLASTIITDQNGACSLALEKQSSIILTRTA